MATNQRTPGLAIEARRGETGFSSRAHGGSAASQQHDFADSRMVIECIVVVFLGGGVVAEKQGFPGGSVVENLLGNARDTV